MHLKNAARRAISFLTACSVAGVSIFSALALSAAPARAAGDAASSLPVGIVEVSTAGCRGGSPAGNPCEGANEAINQTDDKLIKPAMQIALLSAVLNLATFVFDRIAAEAAIWIATGGEGETPLFNAKTAEEAWADFGLDIVGDAIGQLNEEVLDELEIEFDICAPQSPLIRQSIQLGLKQVYQKQEPSCDFQDIRANWESFLATTFTNAGNPSQAVLAAFAEGFRPGKTELSAAVAINLRVHQDVAEAKTANLLEQVNSGGFKAVTDVVTGSVKTPASILQNEFQSSIQNAKEEPTKLQVENAIQNADLLGNMFLHVAGVFTNTLLSQLMNKIYTGLFEEQVAGDPFDLEDGSGGSTREDAANRFASIITASPSQVSNYNVLAEFVACPVGPVAVRGINNCVMDADLANAVSRAEAGVPLTVQEAVDEGLLRGDWPLIPHEGDGIPKNQDPLCYTYGYCYGNLVKMRKARILPVGWEIAASRNDPANPATLQEIIDGFDDCGEQGGGLDATHKWCHLIDPDWALKYPETQCRALVNGELQISTLSPGRAGACADTPSCISEDNDGSCDGGFGYCVEERNAWRFRGEECAEQYASCLSFENTFTSASADYLFNTLDQGSCNADNAGCRWYRTNKYFDDAGTSDDASDDAYEWLPGDEAYVTSDRADDWRDAVSSRVAYAYDTDADGADDEAYETYAYEDRVYFTNDVDACSEAAAGCTALYLSENGLAFNAVRNGSFENDADEDGQPDGWTVPVIPLFTLTEGTLDTSGGYAYYGSNGYSTGSTGAIHQPDIQIGAGNFYTLSFYARQSTGADDVEARVVLRDAEGSYLDLAGTSVVGDCAVADWGVGSDNSVYTGKLTPGEEFERYSCTFSVPDEGNGVNAEILFFTRSAYVDAVQLQLGEDATSFAEGYNSSAPTTAYLRVPPAYLGCSGAATDPAECDDYAQVCSARDVGCNLYTPEDGDPAVPAIASSLDACPSECVGYAAYKQEATDREAEEFPVYFIADGAASCSLQEVGCDAFTNLGAAASGGEGSETYTYLRACVSDDMVSEDADRQSATYFTWEGSDAAGYQLVTWTLLKSDDSAAPCADWDVQDEDTLVCAEDASVDYETDDCDEHDDILENPDCREFYDAAGNVHYRDVTLTVAVDADCSPYRLDDSTQGDCEGSGGYWTRAGDCRYFGLAAESTECPASQAGCRAYTGGAGRNATTVFSDDMEGGDLSLYDEAGGMAGNASVSNESVATDGHSARLAPRGSGGTLSTRFVYLSAADHDATYDPTDDTTRAATCSDYGWTVLSSGLCEIDEDGDGDGECTVGPGDNGCGTLDDQLVAGKSYMLSFWAKGSSGLKVYFADADGTGDQHDFVGPTTPDTVEELALEGAWQSYELGPLDTTDFESFGDDASLVFFVASGETAYVDNVRLKAVEENIAVIKDSWSVPAACDQTPDGADSPQYYLGCEAYTDQNGDAANLYRFTDLCSEEVVGCEAVFDTRNSDSAYGAVYNARCRYVDATGSDALVSAQTACVIEDETVCSIAPGEGFCLFNWDAPVPASLPTTSTADGSFYMTLGPEAVVVGSDVPRYIVDDGSATCTSENAGCREVGVPTYAQDKTSVVSFESAYYLDDPDAYADILCADEELFCEEWASTQDGNFYFKDPVDQACEYQTGVNVDGVSYYGWFKEGTNDPCYADYVVAGQELGIWRNGDEAFAGWAATCPSSYDLCTAFLDLSDTSGGTEPSGTPYYFMDDEALSEESLTASGQCNGRVSQREGCVLFWDSNDSELTYNTTASYAASVHAEELFGDAPGSKQDPISCGEDGAGGEIVTPDGETLNLCERRCSYDVEDDETIVTPSAQAATVVSGFTSNVVYLERSCYADADCPTLETEEGSEVAGDCVEPYPDLFGTLPAGAENAYLLEDDANRVLKVYRDRECAAWLSCQSAQVSWNERTSRYETICDRVGLCTRYTRTGDTSFCTEWADVDPAVLDADAYAARDVTWNGSDFSGYAIPDQLPVATYDQVNVAPDATDFVCVLSTYDSGALPVPEIQADGAFRSCVDEDDLAGDCGDGYECRQVDAEYRLGYVAGSCDLAVNGWLGACVVGHCQESGESCADDGDCSGSDPCVVGYCQDVSATACYSNDDADGDGAADDCDATFPVCDTTKGLCVDELAPNANVCVEDADCSGSGTPTCTPDALSKTGSCVNNQCLTDIFGAPIEPDDAEDLDCRGYPESSSPFPASVVTEWRDPEDPSTPSESPEDFDWEPYSFTYGFETQDTCAPAKDRSGNASASNECECSYDKATYADGAAVRYYPPNTDLVTVASEDDDGNGSGAGTPATGVCVGGDRAGLFCATDTECQSDGSTYSGGTCAKFDRKDTVYGWDGYCLERDTSIQKNGSSSEADRACLTWLPVDQLSGATDLYGKYKGAGYNDGDTYYCAEVDAAYVIRPGETFSVDAANNKCGDGEPETNNCPAGTFTAVWNCANDKFEAMCVPENSYHDGNTEEPCDSGGGVIEIDDGDEYADCETPILTSAAQVAEWIDVADNIKQNYGYYEYASIANNGVIVDAIPSCMSVVKVADSSSYNYAWTDRVFDSSFAQYEVIGIGNAQDALFEFTAETEQSPFGKADDAAEVSPIDVSPGDASSPLSVLMCKTDYSFALPYADATCASGDLVGENARAYAEVEILPAGSAFVNSDITDREANPTGISCSVDADCGGGDQVFCYSGECWPSECDPHETDFMENGCNNNVVCQDGTCAGGARDGLGCEESVDCAVIACVESGISENTCWTAVPVAQPVEDVVDITERLGQFFAKSIRIDDGSFAWWAYTKGNGWTNSTDPGDVGDFGSYEQMETEPAEWDYTPTGDPYSGETPSPPTVVSVGDCDGTECQEGKEDRFSVNGVDSGSVEGSDGYKHVSASFFVYADPNQMPIRNIVMDWGDDDSDLSAGSVPWDTGSQSGSTSDDNFYKNHRGYDEDGDLVCNTSSSEAEDWGHAPNACDTSYVTFVHDYVCPSGLIDDLPTCETTTDPNGITRLIASPCTGGDIAGSSGACVFQPRVHAKDNWGWCTGYCDSGDDPSVPEAYGKTDSLTAGRCFDNECSTNDCPSDGVSSRTCADTTNGSNDDITNPWINFDGFVILTP